MKMEFGTAMSADDGRLPRPLTRVPHEIAEHVGYSSVDAMSRAFRDAKLTAPSALRDLVRYPG